MKQPSNIFSQRTIMQEALQRLLHLQLRVQHDDPEAHGEHIVARLLSQCSSECRQIYLGQASCRQKKRADGHDERHELSGADQIIS